jgi:hypothetical protein
MLGLRSLVVAICTTSFNVKISTFCPHRMYLCVLYGSRNKQRLFPYTALTDCLLRGTNWIFKCKFYCSYVQMTSLVNFRLLCIHDKQDTGNCSAYGSIFFNVSVEEVLKINYEIWFNSNAWICIVRPGVTKFPNIWEPPQNSRRHKGDTKQVPY